MPSGYAFADDPRFDAIAPAQAEAWPVGSLFFSAVETNPSSLLGYGTWETFAAGRFIVGVDPLQAEFDTALETGGAKSVTLSSDQMPAHTHSVTDPGHTHGQSIRNTGTAGTAGTQGANSANNATAGVTASSTTGITIQSTGGGQPISTLPPYIAVFAWRRTA